MNLTPETIVHLPPAAKLAIAQAAAVPAVPIGLLQKTRQSRLVAARVPRAVESATALPAEGVLTIEPIETEPIALSMIDVPPLGAKRLRPLQRHLYLRHRRSIRNRAGSQPTFDWMYRLSIKLLRVQLNPSRSW